VESPADWFAEKEQDKEPVGDETEQRYRDHYHGCSAPIRAHCQQRIGQSPEGELA